MQRRRWRGATDAATGGGGLHLNRPRNRPPPAGICARRCPSTIADSAVGEFFAALAAAWRFTPAQRDRLAPAVETALNTGWTPTELAAFTGGNTDGVRNPYAVLAARLSSAELPAPPARPVRPPWCGGWCWPTPGHSSRSRNGLPTLTRLLRAGQVDRSDDLPGTVGTIARAEKSVGTASGSVDSSTSSWVLYKTLDVGRWTLDVVLCPAVLIVPCR